MLKHTFTWNGHCSDEFGVYIGTDPDKNRPARKFSVANIKGRHGNLYEFEDSFEEVQRQYDLFCSIGNERDVKLNPITVDDSPRESFKLNKKTSFDSLMVDIDFRNKLPYQSVNYINASIYDAENTPVINLISNISLSIDVYKGTYDFVSGVLTATHGAIDLADMDGAKLQDGLWVGGFNLLNFNMTYKDGAEVWCSAYTWAGYIDDYRGDVDFPDGSFVIVTKQTSQNFLSIFIHDSRYTNWQDLKDSLNGQFIMFQYNELLTWEGEENSVTLDAGEYSIVTLTEDANYEPRVEVSSITSIIKPQNELITDIMEWLYEPNGYAKLSDTYDEGHYREAVLVDIVNIKDMFQKYARATVTFRCRPERFLTDSSVSFDTTKSTTLVENIESERIPVLEVPMGNTVAYLQSKGYAKWLEDIDVPTYIKTLSQITAYKDSELTIEADPLSADMYYEIWNLYYDNVYGIYVGNSQRYIKRTNNIEIVDRAPYFKIKIYDNDIVGYVLSNRCNKVKGYELNNPTKHIAKPVIKLTGKYSGTINNHNLMVNDVILKAEGISQIFTIDCETENVTDAFGVSINQKVAITDTDGNTIAKFISLKSGMNMINYDNKLDIETRFWEI